MSTIACATMLLLMISSSSCSSVSATLLPTLENRTLWFDPDRPGLFYNHYVCVKKKLLGGCKDWQLETDRYDLTDPAVRKQLIDMGFVAKVRDKKSP